MSDLTITGYEPRFDIDLRRGKVGEEYVGTIIGSLLGGTVEVKTDYGVHRTGNLYIEYEQSDREGNMRPSGLATTEANFWAFAFRNGAVIVETETLKEVCRELLAEGAIGRRAPNQHSAGTSGVLLPLATLIGRLRSHGQD